MHSTPKLRAVKKERKHYHYDWSVVADPGPRFENMVASLLTHQQITTTLEKAKEARKLAERVITLAKTTRFTWGRASLAATTTSREQRADVRGDERAGQPVVRVAALLPRLHALAVLVPEIGGELARPGVEELRVLQHLVVEVILGRNAERTRNDGDMTRGAALFEHQAAQRDLDGVIDVDRHNRGDRRHHVARLVLVQLEHSREHVRFAGIQSSMRAAVFDERAEVSHRHALGLPDVDATQQSHLSMCHRFLPTSSYFGFSSPR